MRTGARSGSEKRLTSVNHDRISLAIPIIDRQLCPMPGSSSPLLIRRISQWLGSNRYILCFAAIGMIYFLNLFIDIMDIDASQYASISREMLENGSFLEVYHRGHDYLDKPPLLFWISSLSFSILGISNFAYKLPSVLILILGIFSTYKLAELLYDRQKGMVAALILGATQAFFQITNDVRTENLLISMTIFALWQLVAYLRHGKMKHLLFASVGLAGAMLAKGPIGLVIVAFALGGELLLKRKWRDIFKPQWILLLALVLLLLLPMCYGLYTQFDLHPEKEVYGLKGPSGLKFFFWTQSFGRITGDIYWKNEATFFYFFHTILWDFQPWILLFLPALFWKLKDSFKEKFRAEHKEYITLSGALISFFALSLSAFKLPHYVFPLFPFFSVITADFIVNICRNQQEKLLRILTGMQYGILHFLFLAGLISFLFFFNPGNWWLPSILVLLFILFQVSYYKLSDSLDRILIPSVIAMFAFGLILSTYFYPNLLKYQPDNEVGRWVYKQNIPQDRFFEYGARNHSLEFYARRIVPPADTASLPGYPEGTLIFTDEKGLEDIIQVRKLNYTILKAYEQHKATSLTLPFLLKKSRPEVIGWRYLIRKSSPVPGN